MILIATALATPSIDEPLRTGEKASGEAAVVIGVEDYDDLPDVPYARRDARAFGDFLVYTRGIPADRVQRKEDASREQILGAVQTAAKEAKGGTVWIYYAGHGAADPSTGERMLLGDDTKADPAVFAARAVRIGELEKTVRDAGGKPVIVLDTCYAGVGRSGESLTGGSRMAVPAYAWKHEKDSVVWTATSADELSNPLPQTRHGAFTWFAIGAMRGWADGELDGSADGTVSSAEAQAYVSRALRTVQERGQTPTLVGPSFLLSKGDEAGPELATLFRSDAAPPTADFQVDGADKAVVEFRTEPAGASISVAGAWLCETPCSKALPKGDYSIEVQLARYQTVKRDVRVPSSTVKITLEPTFGWIDVDSKPSGLSVALDDQPAGRTPIKLEASIGTHSVRIDDPTWHPSPASVDVLRGKVSPLRLDARPRLGGLVLEARDKDGNDLVLPVILDGKSVGKTPFSDEVQIGKHTLAVGDDSRTITIEEGQTEKLDLTIKNKKPPSTISAANKARRRTVITTGIGLGVVSAIFYNQAIRNNQLYQASSSDFDANFTAANSSLILGHVFAGSAAVTLTAGLMIR